MELLEFIKSLPPEELDAFAMGVGTTVPHLRNVAYKQRVASAALAAQIQVRSGGKVQVAALRPKDWHPVWGRDVNQTMNWGGIVAEGGEPTLPECVGVVEALVGDESMPSVSVPADVVSIRTVEGASHDGA